MNDISHGIHDDNDDKIITECNKFHPIIVKSNETVLDDDNTIIIGFINDSFLKKLKPNMSAKRPKCRELVVDNPSFEHQISNAFKLVQR